MTNQPATLYFNLDQQRISIAIRRRRYHFQTVARGLAFRPKLIAGAAEKGDISNFLGPRPCLSVHEPEHEDFAVSGILYDGRHQTLHLVEVKFHFSPVGQSRLS